VVKFGKKSSLHHARKGTTPGRKIKAVRLRMCFNMQFNWRKMCFIHMYNPNHCCAQIQCLLPFEMDYQDLLLLKDSAPGVKENLYKEPWFKHNGIFVKTSYIQDRNWSYSCFLQHFTKYYRQMDVLQLKSYRNDQNTTTYYTPII